MLLRRFDRVRVLIDDSEFAQLVGSIVKGTLQNLVTSGGARGECAELRLDVPLKVGERLVTSVLALPRHKGYGFHRWGIRSVAVYLVPLSNGQNSELARERPFALGLLSKG